MHSDSQPSLKESVCDYAGHEWGDAGGGLLICLVCEEEKWDANARGRCPCGAPQSQCQGCVLR